MQGIVVVIVICGLCASTMHCCTAAAPRLWASGEISAHILLQVVIHCSQCVRCVFRYTCLSAHVVMQHSSTASLYVYYSLQALQARQHIFLPCLSWQASANVVIRQGARRMCGQGHLGSAPSHCSKMLDLQSVLHVQAKCTTSGSDLAMLLPVADDRHRQSGPGVHHL